MQKLGGMICDMCRTIIRDGKPFFERKAKKGNTLHFCSEQCKLKDTPKKERPHEKQ